MARARIRVALLVLGMLAAGCGVGADALADKRCRDAAKEDPSQELLREQARDLGVPEEFVVESFGDPDQRRVYKAFFWANCLTDKGWECEAEVAGEPPTVCRGDNLQQPNPFLEE